MKGSTILKLIIAITIICININPIIHVLITEPIPILVAILILDIIRIVGLDIHHDDEFNNIKNRWISIVYPLFYLCTNLIPKGWNKLMTLADKHL